MLELRARSRLSTSLSHSRRLARAVRDRLQVPERELLEWVRRDLRAWRAARRFEAIVSTVRPYTMVNQDPLVHLGRLVDYVVENDIRGDLVECGVWRGGAAFLMARRLEQLSDRRRVWLLDSFEGLPEPSVTDGQLAAAFGTDDCDLPDYDNCTAGLEEVQRIGRSLGVENAEYVRGWFNETLISARERIGPIAILRIDADWYESVKCCLWQLYDQVVDGGFIVLDDYYHWEGCAIATHEFLTARRLPHRIETIGADDAAFIRKTPAGVRYIPFDELARS